MVNLSLGPILGEITEKEMVCMIEIIDHRNKERKIEIEMIIRNIKDGIEERQKKECKQGEPIYFYVDNLKRGEKYKIKFEENGKEIKDTELYGGGLIEYDCEFKTMNKTKEELKIGTVSCNQIESNQNTNLWKEIQDKWFEGELGEKLDIMIHMGDQVYLDKQYHQGVNALKMIDKSQWYTRVKDIILSVREEYRKTWGSNRNMLKIMASCCNLMILDDHEVCDSWGRLDSHYDIESVEYYVGSIIIQLYLQYQQNLLVSSHKLFKNNTILTNKNITEDITINNNSIKELQHNKITFENQEEKSYPCLTHFLKTQHNISESYFGVIEKDWKPRPWNLKHLSHFHIIGDILIFFLEHRTYGSTVHFGKYQTNLLSDCLLHYKPNTLLLISPIPPIRVNKMSGKIWNKIFDQDNDSWSESEILSLFNLLHQWKYLSPSHKLSIFSGDLHMGALSSIYYYPSYTSPLLSSFSYIDHTSSCIISDEINSNTLNLQTLNNIHKSDYSFANLPSNSSTTLPPLPSSLSLNNYYLGQLIISSSVSTQPVFVQKLQKFSFETNSSTSSYFLTYHIPFRLHRNYSVSFINSLNISHHLIFSQENPSFFNPNSLKNSLSSVLNWLNLCIQPLPSS